MFRAFQASSFAKPRGTIVGVEEELRGQVIPGVPDLLARVDLMVDEADAFVVTDFKSARSSWSEEHVGDAASQLLLYHELVKPLADGKPVRLRFAVLTKNKVPDLAMHEVPVAHHQIERTKRIAERVWRSIRAGNFYPSPGAAQLSFLSVSPAVPYMERLSRMFGPWTQFQAGGGRSHRSDCRQDRFTAAASAAGRQRPSRSPSRCKSRHHPCWFLSPRY
jgi:PD-(D/E)XK nuclease superfamily